MSYYAAIAGKQEGPFTEEELRQKLGTGIDSQTLVWKEGMESWAPLSQVLPALSGSSILYPAATAAPGDWVPAKRETRLFAALIDIGMIFVIGMIVGLAIPLLSAGAGAKDNEAPLAILIGVLALLFLAVTIVQIVMLVKYSQTVGKRVLKIRIYNIETRKPADWVKTIILRGLVNGIPSLIPFIGGFYGLVDILFIFRDDRRCIHDLIAGTLVGTVPDQDKP